MVHVSQIGTEMAAEAGGAASRAGAGQQQRKALNDSSW